MKPGDRFDVGCPTGDRVIMGACACGKAECRSVSIIILSDGEPLAQVPMDLDRLWKMYEDARGFFEKAGRIGAPS